MSRNLPNIEERLERVERELSELRTALNQHSHQPWYRQIVGDFAKDKAFAEIIRLGRQIRRGKLKG